MDWIALSVSAKHDVLRGVLAENWNGFSVVNLLIVKLNVDLVPAPAIF
jgi:hypothetical protein